MDPSLLLLVNAACALYLTGLIWTIQVVHYPSFSFVSETSFTRFASFHQSHITPIVGPVMIVELLTAIALVLWRPVEVSSSFAVVGLGLVIVVWLSTFLVQVPIHAQLDATGKDAAAISRLLISNWVRTAAWTARSVLLTWCIWRLMSSAA